MKIDLTGKRVLVTAGASGIGRATALGYAEAGAQVFICDVDENALEQSLTWERPVRPLYANVASSADVDRVFDAIEAEAGGLDILVNNAGIAGPTKPIEEITDAEWAETMSVNVSGQFYCARRAVPGMKAQLSGVILNISSTAGRMGMPLRSPYSTSKYAVRGLTDVLAVELGEHNIRVNSILPGLIDGPRGERVVAAQADMMQIEPQRYLSAMLHNISMHTMIRMEEIAALAVFLSSDSAAHITAQHIGVCGNFETYRSPLTMKMRDVAFSHSD